MPHLGVCRVLPYRPEQLFDLVADVERYPEFLHWWRTATVLKRQGNKYYTDQVVGFGPITQRFSTETVLNRPDRIEVIAVEGPFETFRLNWRFGARPEDRCEIELTGELELRAPLLRDVFGRAMASSVTSILSAFEERASGLYGPPS